MTPIYGNDKIAEAARRFVTVRTAYQDACTMTADDPIDGEAMEAFGAGLVEAERRLIEVCSEPGREPFPEAICPPWLDPDGPCLRQGQVLTPSGPLYLSSDGPTLVALPQATECKAGLKVLRNMMALLNVCGSRWHQIDHGALMSWLMEVVMEVARRESTRVVLAHLVATEAPDVPLVWLRVEPIKNPHCALVRDLFLRAHAGARYDEIETWCRRDAQGWHATGTLEAGIKEAERRYGAAHLSGVRGQESGARALRMQRWGTTTARTCGPIGWWTGLDVFAYLALHDLPIHPAYAMNVGGCLTGSGSASRPSAASGARGMAGRSGRRGTTAVRWRRWTVN